MSHSETPIQKESAIVLVLDTHKRLALQLRAAKDLSYPSHWDFSAAGGIEAGEAPLAAAVRELREEIGCQSSLTYLTTLLYQDDLVQDLLHIFYTQSDGPFSLDPNEVAALQFFPLTQINTLIANGEKFHPEFLFLWNQGLISSLAQ